MKLSIFAENATTQQDTSLRVGQIYSQDELNSVDGQGNPNTIASRARVNGILPNKQVSTILINSILHEVSVILCGIFGAAWESISTTWVKPALENLHDKITDSSEHILKWGDNYDSVFDNAAETTDNETMEKCRKTFCKYLKLLHNMLYDNYETDSLPDDNVVCVNNCNKATYYIYSNPESGQRDRMNIATKLDEIYDGLDDMDENIIGAGITIDSGR